MKTTKIILSLLTLLFVIFLLLSVTLASNLIEVLLLFALIVLYFNKVKQKSLYFLLFLICYIIPQISEFVLSCMPSVRSNTLIVSLSYYILNTFYIAAYLFLILEMLKPISIKASIKKYYIHIIVLLALDIYCVLLLSKITRKSNELLNFNMMIFENVYNVITMLLLTIALLNYLNKGSKKSMNLVLGVLCIVFSEIIQIAYIYISDIHMFNIVYSVLLIFAFVFLYFHAILTYESDRILHFDNL